MKISLLPNKSREYEKAETKAEESLRVIAQLTAVDGAVLLTENADVLAFGAKIKPVNVDYKPTEAIVSEPFETSQEE